MLSELKGPAGWTEILKRTGYAAIKDDVLTLSAGLAYSFFFALFPALIFLVSVASFFPLQQSFNQMISRAGTVMPEELMQIIQTQLGQISQSNNGGLLTFGFLLTIFSLSSGMAAVINALNHAYDISESRPWWKVRLVSVGLVLALGAFLLISFGLVVVGPELAQKVANWVGLGAAFTLAWNILQWPVVFALVVTAVAFVYYYGPDAEQDWVWITPGSLLATVLWILASLGFRFYATNFGAFNATYGALGGVMVALLWLYITGVVLLIGAEMNAEIEHASPYGKAPGEKVPGQKRKIGAAARRAWEEAQRLARGRPRPAVAFAASADANQQARPLDKARGTAEEKSRAVVERVQREHALRYPQWQREPRPDVSGVVLAGVLVGEFALAMWSRMRRRTRV